MRGARAAWVVTFALAASAGLAQQALRVAASDDGPDGRGARYEDAQIARGLALFLEGAPGVQPCAGCHGRDAGGGAEGRWRAPALTRLEARGYDGPQALARALAEGVAPGGRLLATAMPRAQAAALEATALFSALPALAARDRTGVEAETITLHTPPAAPGDPFPRAFAAALDRRLGGAAFGRRVETRDVAEAAFATIGLAETASGAQARRLAREGGLNIFPRAALFGDERPEDVVSLGPTLSALARAAERSPGCEGGVEIWAGGTMAAEIAARLKLASATAPGVATCRLALASSRSGPPTALLARRAFPHEPLAHDPLAAAGLDGDAFADFAAARVAAALIAAGPRPGRVAFMKALRAGDALAPDAPARGVDLRFPRLSGQSVVTFAPLGGGGAAAAPRDERGAR